MKATPPIQPQPGALPLHRPSPPRSTQGPAPALRRRGQAGTRCSWQEGSISPVTAAGRGARKAVPFNLPSEPGCGGRPAHVCPVSEKTSQGRGPHTRTGTGTGSGCAWQLPTCRSHGALLDASHVAGHELVADVRERHVQQHLQRRFPAELPGVGARPRGGREGTVHCEKPDSGQ